MQNYNPGKMSLVYGDETTRIFGRDYIIEKLGDVSFKLSARAFFQMNPIQTKKMYDEVKQALNLKQGEILVDAYCGVGTIGLYCGKEAGLVLGMDVVSEAIADAKENLDWIKTNIQGHTYFGFTESKRINYESYVEELPMVAFENLMEFFDGIPYFFSKKRN